MKSKIISAIHHCVVVSAMTAMLAACGGTEPVDPKPEVLPKIELVAPAEAAEILMDNINSVSFEWTPVDTIDSYKLKFGLDAEFKKSKTVIADANPFIYDKATFVAKLADLGVSTEADTMLYWTILPAGTEKAETFVRTIRIVGETPYADRIADKITVKVAIVYEDPILPGAGGKRMHDVCTVHKGGAHWNDPRLQSKKYEEYLEEASHGVLDYVVVKEIEADHFFSYCDTAKVKHFNTTEEWVDYFATLPDDVEVGSHFDYDYSAMVKYYGFGKMRDAGEIQEVWVYSHPACGMYESRMIGLGAFWLNSPGLNDSSLCTDLLNVMFCNYERTVDLALHSYGHRFESIMKWVYARWTYTNMTSTKTLNNWERYSAYGSRYATLDAGYSNCGNVHFPPNGANDYDYGNSSSIYTYADEWFNYPNIKENKAAAHKITSSEWGRTQQGYMMWWFSHMPHFKGLNVDAKDRHLNNWWYYVVDYNAAKKYEAQLRQEANQN